MSLFAALFVAFACASPVEVFVSSVSGDDTHNGSTRALPLKSLAKAAQVVAALSGNVSLVLFPDERFEACELSFRAASGSLLFASESRAFVTCSRMVNASGLDVVGVLEFVSPVLLHVENVSFVDFSSFNASSVALLAPLVLVNNVAVLNNSVEAESVDTVAPPPHLYPWSPPYFPEPPPVPVLRSALHVNATHLEASRCVFANNTLSVAVTVLILEEPIIYQPFALGPTLHVPGGGALAVNCSTATVTSCLFESNHVCSLNNDPIVIDRGGDTLGPRGALCGGGVLVIGSISIEDSHFVNNSVSAVDACGGAVAILAMDADEVSNMFTSRISWSTFDQSWHAAGAVSNGMSVALIEWPHAGPQESTAEFRLSVQDTNFTATVAEMGTLQGAAAVAPSLRLGGVTVSRFNITTSEVSGGLFSAGVIHAYDLVLVDNVFRVGVGAGRGVLIGPFQNVSGADQDQAYLVGDIYDSLIARNTIVLTMEMSGAVIHGSLNNIENVRIADNTFVDEASIIVSAVGLVDVVSSPGSELYSVTNVTFLNNSGMGLILRTAVDRVYVSDVVFTANRGALRSVFLARCTDVMMSDVQMFGNDDAARGIIIAVSGSRFGGLTVHNSTFGPNSFKEALVVEAANGAVEISVQMHNCSVEQGVITLRKTSSFALTGSRLNSSSVVSFIENTELTANVNSFEVTSTAFWNCAPAIVQTFSGDSSVFTGQRATDGSSMTLRNCRFTSELPATAAPMLVVDLDSVDLDVSDTVFSGGAWQSLAVLSCAFSGRRLAITGTSGFVLSKSDKFELRNSVLRGVTGNSLDATSTTLVRLTNVALVASGPLVMRSVDEFELVNVTISNASAPTSLVDLSDVRNATFQNVSIVDSVVAGSGTVKLAGVGDLALSQTSIANCTALRGGAFYAMAIGRLACNASTATSNRAVLAGGAVLAGDADAGRLADCLQLSNNSAGSYGPERASTHLSLNVSRLHSAPPMPGVLLGLRVEFVDAFGQKQRQLSAGNELPLRDDGMSIVARLTCRAGGSGSVVATQTLLVCFAANTAEACDADNLFLPGRVGDTCEIEFMPSVDASLDRIGSAFLNVTLQPCAFGFGVESSASPACVACSPRNVAVGGNSSCHACPSGAVCCGGSRVFAEPDFFLVESVGQSARLIAERCLPGVCLGERTACSLLRDVEAPLENRCAPFRTGLLCAACNETGLVPIAPDDAASSASCLRCDDWNVGAIIAAVAGLALFAVVLHVASNGQRSSGLLKIVMFYAQIAGQQASGGIISRLFASLFGFRVAAATGAMGGVCLGPIGHFGIIVVRLCVPIALFVLLLCIAAVSSVARAIRLRFFGAGEASWGILRLCGARERSDTKLLASDGENASGDESSGIATDVALFSRRRLLRTGMAIVLSTFSVALEATLDLFYCVEIGSSHVFASDVRFSCESETSNSYRNFAMFFLMPFMIAVVLGVLGAMQWLRAKSKDGLPASHPVLGVIFECYKARARLYWESFVLLRRCAIGVTAVFVADLPLRRFLFTLVNVVSLLTTVVERPFADSTENVLDILCQTFLVLLSVNAGDGLDDGFRTFLVFLSPVPLVVVTAVWLARRWHQLLAFVRFRKANKDKR